MSILHRMRRLSWHLGLDVGRFPESARAYGQVQQLLHHGINVVVDVGANNGDYGRELRLLGYGGRIVSFEPLPSCFDLLSRRVARDPLWSAHPLALGAEVATVTLNVAANNGASSSILPMLDRHRHTAPDAVYVDAIPVRQEPLDAMWPKIVSRDERPFLKLDVQGYEQDVLRGAEKALQQCAGIQLELSLVPLYEGAMLYRDALDLALGLGFSLSCLRPGFSDPETGQTLQVDCMFFR